MKNLYILVILLLLQVIVNAQSVTGKIVDEHGEGLSGLDLKLYSASEVFSSVTSSDGSFVFDILTDVKEESELPTGFKISMNYPNPFNPKTRFVLELPTASNVSVDVYNVLGERVLGNITKYYSAGINYIDLELNGLPNGIYISSFKIDNKYTINRKMLLLYGSQHLTEGSGNIASSGNTTGLRKTTYNKVLDSLVASSTITGSKVFTGLPTITDQAVSLGEFTFERYCPGMPTVMYEGKTYNTVQIGDQCWLKENLDAGVMLQPTENPSDNSIMEKYCYDNDPNNCTDNGGLYQWDEAMQYFTTEGAKGICPEGWHIPTKAEFEALKEIVDNNGNALKAKGEGEGTDVSGFSAIMSGYRKNEGIFTGIGDSTFIWSSSVYVNQNAYPLNLVSNKSSIGINYLEANNGFSVRCVKGGNLPGIPRLTNPINGAIDQNTSLTLIWQPISGTASYTLQVSEDGLFGSYVYNESNLTQSNKQISDLTNLKKYYWRVNAKNSYGTSAWSTVWSFTTIGTAPGVPTLLSPANDTTEVGIPLTLNWQAVTEAASYTLQVSEDSLFGSFVYNQIGLKNTSKEITGLNYLKKYYWRVNGKNSYGTSAWSTVWSFTTTGTAPGVPTLISPLEGAINQNTSITFSWQQGEDVNSYTLQISENSSFTNIVFNESGIIGINKLVNGLNSNTKYYWRVSSTNIYGTSSFSASWSFTTLATCPGLPTVRYEGKIYNTIKIGVQCWLKENLNIGTMIQVGQNSGNNGTIEKYCYDNDTSNCNTYGGLYQWNEAMQYVTTENAKGICPTDWHIPTLSDLQALKSAVNDDGNSLKEVGAGTGSGAGTNTSGFSALLAGNRDQGSYFSNINSFAYLWSSNEANIDNSNCMILYPSNANINIQNLNKNFGFSVRCVKNDSPAIPSLNSPNEGDTITSTFPIPNFVWNQNSAANSYTLQISEDNNFMSIVYTKTEIKDTNHMVTILSENTTYYWRVSATNIYGTSEWSEVWTFTTRINCDGVKTVNYAGKTYNTVQIGDQCWLKENLNVGTMIQNNNSSDNGIIEKYCYNNDVNNCETYGGLYQWDEAMQYVSNLRAKGICPTGWHIPSIMESQTLIDETNNKLNMLLEKGQGNGTNETGFSALLAGYRTSRFEGLGYYNYLWSSTEIGNSSFFMGIKNYVNTIDLGTSDQLNGFSVRCIKDREISSPTMILVEGGTFQMGSNDVYYSNAQPVHTVTLSSYYIGKYEVTQEEYEAVMGKYPSDFKGSKKPIENVSWYEAVEFCNKMSEKEGLEKFYNINGYNVTMNWGAKGYRLPTEAEWEYAARGGNRSNGYTYSGSNNIDEVGWYYLNSGNETHEVGNKQPNELGIYDMSGNVFEWCNDWYGLYDRAPQTNPRGPENEYNGFGRILRGGSWLSYDFIIHVAYRNNVYPEKWDGNIGFRLSRPF